MSLFDLGCYTLLVIVICKLTTKEITYKICSKGKKRASKWHTMGYSQINQIPKKAAVEASRTKNHPGHSDNNYMV